MNEVELLKHFIGRLSADNRLKPIHMALLIALCNIWILNKFGQFYNISARQLMGSSRIKSKATYHKTLRELQIFGYLDYYPTSHPKEGSTIRLKVHLLIDREVKHRKILKFVKSETSKELAETL